MDFSKWAVVSYKDDTGLGRQATDLRAVLDLGYRLVVPSKHLEGLPLTEPNEISLDPNYPDEKVRSILASLEGIIFPECNRWHPRLLFLAKELRVKTVCVPNWEWFDGNDEQWRACDLLVCHSQFTERIVHKYGWRNTVCIPATLDLSKFPKRSVSGPARTFIHNAGLVNEDDRKGTRDTILAFRKVKRNDISLVVRMQKEVPLPDLDERIKVQVGNLANPKELYETGDVAVQPSKLEGVGFMILEPLCSGMPVVTLDYPPMNEYVKSPELLVAKRWFKRKGFPTHWIKHAHLRLPDITDLARKIEWCTNNDMAAISETNRNLANTIFSRDTLREKWAQALSKL
jgi:glycosyltransferase involved in cell wall biosynthesis